MWTLAEGAYVELQLDDAPSQVYSLAAAGSVAVAAVARPLLLQLLHGLAEREAGAEDLAPLRERGLMVQRRSLSDRVLRDQLDRLCARWTWQRPAGVEGRRFQTLYRRSLEAHARRKAFVQDFGQTPCLPETSVRRALCAARSGQRVLCVGDDDLVAVPLAMLGCQVEVVDIDSVLLLPLLDRLASDWGLDIRTRVLDLRRPLPGDLRARFDLVLTDPMSTRACFELFLSRGLAALRPGGRLLSCVHPAALEVFEQVRAAMRLPLAAYHAEFSHYYNEEFREDAYVSDLAELVKTPGARPVLAASAHGRADIFAETASYRQHAWSTLRTPMRKFREDRLERALQVLQQSELIDTTGWQETRGPDGRQLVACLRGGGSLSLNVPAGAEALTLAVYPFDEQRDTALLRLLSILLPNTLAHYGQGVARPLRQLLGERESSDS